MLQLVLLTVMPNQMFEQEVHHRYNLKSSLWLAKLTLKIESEANIWNSFVFNTVKKKKGTVMEIPSKTSVTKFNHLPLK